MKFTTVISAALLAVASACSAQTQINPATQIRWPMITGAGTPASLFIACGILNYGQPYQNTAVTPNTYYTCGTDGWAIRGGSGGGGITALTGPVTASGTGSVPTTITPTGVTPGPYTNANISINAAGQVTAAANGSSGGYTAPTLGATLIPSGAIVPAVTGLSVNGVTLQTSGSTGAFLNQAGGYSTPSGGTVQIVYASVACAPYTNSDPNLGGGTDGTACINAALSSATAANPILYYQDKGTTLISGAGIVGPSTGNWGITGNGGGLTQTPITACSITGGNLATFTTTVNMLTAGQGLSVKGLSNCSALNGLILTVLSAGLTSTQFEATVSASNVSSASESGFAISAYGTGFFLAAASETIISNGDLYASGNCGVVPLGRPPSRGANISLSNVVLNGNGQNQSNYCFGAFFHDVNGVNINGVTFYNMYKFSSVFANTGDVNISQSLFQAAQAYPGGPINTDGIHIDGPANDFHISDDTFETGDDSIALNANEGYCGPINRVAITNSILANSFDGIRAYNNGITCANGLVPTIDTVDINNYSGTVYYTLGVLGQAVGGGGPIGPLNPALTNFRWANSTVDVQGGGTFSVNENIGLIDLADDTWIGVANTPLLNNFTTGSATTLGQLILNNVKYVRNAAHPSGGASIAGSLSAYTIGSVVVTGGGIYNAIGYAGGNATCFLCVISGNPTVIDNLYYDNIDTNLIPNLFFPGQYGTNILAANNNSVSPPSGLYTVNGNSSVTGKLNTGANLDFVLAIQTGSPHYSLFSFNGNIGASYLGIAGGDSTTGDNSLYESVPTGGAFNFAINAATVVGTLNINGFTTPSVKTTTYTVGTLPSASTLGAGAQVVVSDATTFTPGTCTGGGTDYMIAISSGTSWSCH